MPTNERQALLRRVCLLKLALTQSEFTYQDYIDLAYMDQPIVDDSIRDLRDTFDKDRKILETHFGVIVQNKPGIRNVYQVTQVNPEFQPLYLTPEWLQVLAVLQLPQNAGLFPKNLLESLANDVERRYGKLNRQLAETLEQALTIAAWRDTDSIDLETYQQLWRAQKDRFIVEFDYLPARDDDDDVRHHRVEPYRIHVDDGHLYLYAYSLDVKGPYGEFAQNQHRDYRIGRIVKGSLHVQSKRFPRLRVPRRYEVHYILSQRIASRGASYSFEGELSRTWLEDDRLEIRASTTRPLQAVQRLLRYGGQCEVLGGAKIRADYLQELQAMQAFYPKFG